MDHITEFSKNHLFVDLHAHFSADPEYYSLVTDTIYDALSPKVDIISVCERDSSNNDAMRFDVMRSLFENSDFKVKHAGKLFFTVDGPVKPLTFIKSQEIHLGPFHVVVVGSQHNFSSYASPHNIRDVKKTIAKEKTAFLVFAHPFSVAQTGFIPFHIGNKSDAPEIMQIAGNCDLLEGFNAHNILWMKKSNLLAETFAKEQDIPLVSDSDAHFSLSEMARSGTFINRGHLSFADDAAFFNSLRTALVSRNHIPCERYVSLKGFYSSIFKKHLKLHFSSK